MVTLGRKKKSDEKNILLEGDMKKTASDADPDGFKWGGLFRNNNKVPGTPPMTTPDSKSSMNNKRAAVEIQTIHVPQMDDEGRIDMTRTVSDLTFPHTATGGTNSNNNNKDPPASMMRTTSLEATTQISQSSIMDTKGEPKDPAPSDKASEESLVTKMLGIVDLSCGAATGLVSPQEKQNSDIRQVLSFQPEWGVAPQDDEEEKSAPSSKSGSNTQQQQQQKSLVKQELAARAAAVAASADMGEKRHETFELVYRDPPSPKQTKFSWKLGRSKSKDEDDQADTANNEDHHEPEESPETLGILGIAQREEPLKDGKNVASAAGGAITTYDPIPPMPDKEYSAKPAEVPRATKERAGRPVASVLRKAFGGKKKKERKNSPEWNECIDDEDENDVKEKDISGNVLSLSTGESPEESIENVAQSQEAPQRFRKTLKSIKSPILETVQEEDESFEALKVRVPGVQTSDSYITDKELLGDEVVEEIYASIDKSIAQEVRKKLDMSTNNNNTSQKLQIPVSTNNNNTSQKLHISMPSNNNSTSQKLQIPVSTNTSQKLQSPMRASTAATASPHKTKVEPQKSRNFSDIAPAQAANLPTTRTAPYQEFKEGAPPSIPHSKSWIERLGLLKSRSTEMKRTLSTPNSPGKTKGIGKNDKQKKPMWKSAVDPATGKTYYYHRKTRETTWTKPPGYDLAPSKDTKNKVSTETLSSPNRKEGEAILRKKSSRDFNPEVWKTKKEISHLLSQMEPPDGAKSVEQLVSQYDGREAELLKHLRNISEAKPFDEPMERAAERQADAAREERAKKMSDGRSLSARTPTGIATLHSGFSGKFSSKSRLSEKTQQINNTSKKPSTTATQDLLSTSTSISSKQDGMPPSKMSPARLGSGAERIPKNIPVPRSRELNVEEFTTRDRVSNVRPKRRQRPPLSAYSMQKGPYHAPPTDTNYLGDSEDNEADRSTTTGSYAATDSISALSDIDNFSLGNQNKDVYQDARLRALDRAIAQEDWDLAAQLSEGMRRASSKAGRSRVAPQVPREWEQSAMDRFISENDWDAVTAYIARLRANAKASERRMMNRHLGVRNSPNRQVPSARNVMSNQQKQTENPQKRFGARSQLQHRELETSGSSESYSTYSSENSSVSYEYSGEAPRQRPPVHARQREFAC